MQVAAGPEGRIDEPGITSSGAAQASWFLCNVSSIRQVRRAKGRQVDVAATKEEEARSNKVRLVASA